MIPGILAIRDPGEFLISIVPRSVVFLLESMILLPLLVTFSVTLEVLPAGTFETPKPNLIALRAFTAVPRYCEGPRASRTG